MDENEIPVTLRASVRGGMKPGYMCSTASSRQVSTPTKPNIRRRPFQNLSNEQNVATVTPRRVAPETIVVSSYVTCHAPRKRIASSRTKKDAATNTDGPYDDIDSVIQLLRELNYGMDKPACAICTGTGEEGWRAMIPCGHEFCEGCRVWEKESRCPICREFIIQPLKVFR